jgi:small subunit ribosomal protein S18
MDSPRGDRGGLGDDEGLDRDGDDRRGGKGRGGAGQRRKLLSDEIVAKIDYKNPQILRSFVTDRGKMIPRRISGASARQQRVISTALRRARMLALLPFSVTGD